MDRLARIDMIIELLKKEPDDVFLNYALGVEYFSELNLDGAEQQFKRVLEINADYVPVYYQFGKLLESRENKKEALKLYLLGLQKAKEQKNNKTANEFDEAIFMLGE